jgi:hypothetical protein
MSNAPGTEISLERSVPLNADAILPLLREQLEALLAESARDRLTLSASVPGSGTLLCRLRDISRAAFRALWNPHHAERAPRALSRFQWRPRYGGDGFGRGTASALWHLPRSI